MINYIGTFNVKPSLPEKLEPLREIANNLFWTWNKAALELFRRLDKNLWESTNHNPVMLLGKIDQEKLQEAADDDGFVAHMKRVYDSYKTYLSEKTWYGKNFDDKNKSYIAYFSAEFGLTECLQIYSGGLGVLAGDHLKAASDLGVPLVGVGLCYKEGYFQQYLTADGWQQERYEITDFYNQPMKLVLDEKDQPIKVNLDFPGRKVYMQIWSIDVGRITLYLLDTNVPENTEEDKQITRALYGGNKETRIQQEIVLGVGGIKALHALGRPPLICHMNEGHSAFLSLERIKILINKYKLSFEEAKDSCFYSNIFTTHTPVPAGIDVFGNDLVEKYFKDYYRKELGISDKEFYNLGTIIKDKEPENFNMAHLAMNMAGFVNGVSKLHGKVSKKMWTSGFNGIPFNEIPIDYVTNGIHTESHLSGEMFELLYRYLGEKFLENQADPVTWSAIEDIPDEELWRTHERRRERLVAFARKRLKKQLISRGTSSSEIDAAKEVLDPAVLTIGFARRFATYKRATLIFKDEAKLESILCNPDRPAQMIIAGKAHPQDVEGKKLIQEIAEIAKKEMFRKKIVFLENYDMNIARYMVEGCDVWLNNPRRPYEASGTSGMKLIANGGLNLSILDGWWDEGYHYSLGWAIGQGEDYKDLDYQDEVESRLIFEKLEKEIAPLFYDRKSDNLPRNWIRMMKNSMKNLGPVYNTHRMVMEYTNKFYRNAIERRNILMENDWDKTKKFTSWKSNLIKNWNKIKFLEVNQTNETNELKVGNKYTISAKINLGGLSPEDIDVQVYYGFVDQNSDAEGHLFSRMNNVKDEGNGVFSYSGNIKCETTGNFGYTLRVLPKHPLLNSPFELGLIKWA